MPPEIKYICPECNSKDFEFRHHIGAIAIFCSGCGTPVGAITIGHKFNWVKKLKRNNEV